MNKAQKGKQATRGLKQILAENEETIKFYSLVSISSPLNFCPPNLLLYIANRTR